MGEWWPGSYSTIFKVLCHVKHVLHPVGCLARPILVVLGQQSEAVPCAVLRTHHGSGEKPCGQGCVAPEASKTHI